MAEIVLQNVNKVFPGPTQVIHDKTGGSFGFYGQDPRTESSNPYTSGSGVGGVNNGGHGYFGGLQPWQLFQNFPWSRLRLLAGTHCTSAPCL